MADENRYRIHLMKDKRMRRAFREDEILPYLTGDDSTTLEDIQRIYNVNIREAFNNARDMVDWKWKLCLSVLPNNCSSVSIAYRHPDRRATYDIYINGKFYLRTWGNNSGNKTISISETQSTNNYVISYASSKDIYYQVCPWPIVALFCGYITPNSYDSTLTRNVWTLKNIFSVKSRFMKSEVACFAGQNNAKGFYYIDDSMNKFTGNWNQFYGLTGVRIPNKRNFLPYTSGGGGQWPTSYCSKNVKKVIFAGTLDEFKYINESGQFYTPGDSIPNSKNLWGSLSTLYVNDEELPENIPTSIVYHDGETTVRNCWSGLKQFTSLVLPNSITSIDSGAFSMCTNLEFDLSKFPSSVHSIPYHCFYRTKVYGTIPSTVTSIGSKAFQYCPNSFSIDNDNNNITSIGSQAFSNSHISGKIVVKANCVYSDSNDSGFQFENCYYLKEIEIEYGVTTISGRCFYNCSGVNMEEFIVPSSITHLSEIGANRGGMQFCGCKFHRLIFNANVSFIPASFNDENSSLKYTDIGPTVTSLRNTGIKYQCFSTNPYSVIVLRGDTIPSGLSDLYNHATITIYCKSENLSAFQAELGNAFAGYIGFITCDNLPQNPEEGKYYYQNSDFHIYKYENSAWADITATYV